MPETPASAVAAYAPPDCAICERSLLVGESIRLFRDRGERLVKVCDLCRGRAAERGYERLGSHNAPRLRVQPSGSLNNAVSRDALIEGLGNELAYLKQQLGVAQSALSEHSLQEDAVRAINDRLRRQERELERLRSEADPVARAHEQRTIRDQAQHLHQMRDTLRERDAQVTRLQVARTSEASSQAMCSHALDAFNSSEHADRMLRITRTLGEPTVTANDQGMALPRRVHITLVWDEIAWYDFCIKLDLGSGRASVHELASGGDPRALAPEQLRGNASWRSSGLVMT